MKNRKIKDVARVLLCLALVMLLSACGMDTDVSRNDGLAEQFVAYALQDDYTAAYDLCRNAGSNEDFRACWDILQMAVEGAETYEMHQVGWHTNMVNGVTTRTSTYRTTLDNGRILLLEFATEDGVEGLVGFHFSDATDFVEHTEAFVPVWDTVLAVFSILCHAFCIWLLVDCLRRKMKYKVLWAILCFAGVTLTVTVGESFGFNFMVGLQTSFSTISADIARMVTVTKVVIPVGAILYCCLRKRFTIPPTASAETAAVSDTDETAADAPPSDVYAPEENGEK